MQSRCKKQCKEPANHGDRFNNVYSQKVKMYSRQWEVSNCLAHRENTSCGSSAMIPLRCLHLPKYSVRVRGLLIRTEFVTTFLLHEQLLIPHGISELVDKFLLLFVDCLFSTFTAASGCAVPRRQEKSNVVYSRISQTLNVQNG
jgi:hypothetical protein